MALTKIDIVQNVSDRLGFSRKDSIRIVESMFEIMKEQLSQGNAVKYRVLVTSSSKVKMPVKVEIPILVPNVRYPPGRF